MSVLEENTGSKNLLCEVVTLNVCRAIFAAIFSADGSNCVSDLRQAWLSHSKKTKKSLSEVCQRLLRLAGFLKHGTHQIFLNLPYHIDIMGLENILKVHFSVTSFSFFFKLIWLLSVGQ
jgi:hypothetical protein